MLCRRFSRRNTYNSRACAEVEHDACGDYSGLIHNVAGKREATVGFDIGQGTQDLGFRAEVPILFTVRPAKRD